MKPATQQPLPGQVVVYCAHMIDEDGKYLMKAGSHWFGMKSQFRAPDGSVHLGQWFNCCDLCYRKLDGQPLRLLTHTPVGGHLVWTERAPVIADCSS